MLTHSLFLSLSLSALSFNTQHFKFETDLYLFLLLFTLFTA